MPFSLVQVCNPTFKKMKWIGLDLIRENWIILIYSQIMLLTTLVSNVVHQYFYLNRLISSHTHHHLTSSLIKQSNISAFIVGVHLAFFFTSQANWKQLLKLLNDIQINPEFLKKLFSGSRIVDTIVTFLVLWVRPPPIISIK